MTTPLKNAERRKPLADTAREKIPCMCCRRPFKSTNRKTHRMCDACRRQGTEDSSPFEPDYFPELCVSDASEARRVRRAVV